MINWNHLFSYLLLFLFFLGGCKKEPGAGGRASIHGKIQETLYNKNFGQIVEKQAAAEVNVYIVYGDDRTHSDRVRTNYDGSFEFKYLRKGNYYIYTYSEDSTENQLTDKIPVGKSFFIESNKETLDAGVISIASTLDYDDGYSSICGKVYKVNYNGSFTTIQDEFYVGNENVYIQYSTDSTYFDKVDTQIDGSFCFTNLISGEYKIYCFSDDSTRTLPSGKIEVASYITIPENNQHLSVEDIRILD